MTQLIAVVVTLVYCFVLAWVLLKVVDGLVDLRVEEEEELAGLDLSQHGENAYTL